MLARKYYAQRGHSKGPMNTNAVTQSSSSRGNRILKCCKPIAKQTTLPSSSDKILYSKQLVLQCGTKNENNPKYSSDAVCNVVKEEKGRVTSSAQTENKVANTLC